MLLQREGPQKGILFAEWLETEVMAIGLCEINQSPSQT
jgi:hypothetical protein